MEWGTDELEISSSIDEFRGAAFSMKGDKSPRPDGFSPLFFQQFWEDIKEDIFRLFEEFHAGTLIELCLCCFTSKKNCC